jgi:hypothetical protein
MRHCFAKKIYKNVHTSSGTMAHFAEGLRFDALLTLKVENSICVAGARIPTVSEME